jgi:hypothetical protein
MVSQNLGFGRECGCGDARFRDIERLSGIDDLAGGVEDIRIVPARFRTRRSVAWGCGSS